MSPRGPELAPSSAPANPGLLAGLSPASFGIVMATGIVSLACASLGLPSVGRWLFALNVLLYAVVWGLNLARLLRHPRRMRNDACDHGRAPGFFTAVAASGVLAGTLLLQQSHAWPLLQTVQPFVQGVTLLFWAGGSWWIPLLLVLGVWRHGLQRHPLRYEGLYWAMVFPLGMYAMATHHLALALEQAWLEPLARAFMWAALAAWALAALGLLGALAQALRRPAGA